MEGPREEFLPWTASHHDHEFSPLQTIIIIIIIIIIQHLVLFFFYSWQITK